MVRTITKALVGGDSVAHAADSTAIPVRKNAYKNEALNLLKMTFLRLSVSAIRRALAENEFHFTAAFKILSCINIIVGADEDEERALILADAPFLEHVNCIVLKVPRRMPRPRIVDPTLVEEVHAIPEMNKKENRAPDTKVEKENRAPDTKVKEEKVKQEVAACEIEVTCECCYGDSPSETMIQCDQGKHFFCPGCVEHYVEEQLFGKGTSIVQCISSDGCDAGFSTVQMGCALPDKLREAYDMHQTRTEVAKANIEDLCQCPECNYQVSLPEEFSNLPCPECHHVSCRLCKKAPHELRTCKEAEEAEKKKLSVRALAEEAMTAATVRNCPGPGCGKAFFKVEGCNKMKCPSCKTLSCYLCRQEISDYKHFCQTFNCQHNSCGKCILFTNAEQDDRRARRKAGLKALANAGTTAADVGLLVSPPRKKTAKTHRPLEPARILAGNRRAPEPVAIPVANRRAPEHPVANRRAPEQQRVLEAQLQRDLEAYLQRDLEDHGPADAAHAPAPDNRRAPEPAAIPVVNRRAPAGDDGRLPPAPGGLECTIL